MDAELSDSDLSNSDDLYFQFTGTDEQILGGSFEQTGILLNAKNHLEIRHIVEQFADAFFNGDTENIRKYLADSYDEDITTYQGNGTAGDFTIEGLYTMDEDFARNGIVNISLEYRDNSNPDTLWYLTIAFIRQAEEWKIMWYGLEA